MMQVLKEFETVYTNNITGIYLKHISSVGTI